MKRFITSLALFGIVFFAYDKLFIVVRNQSPGREVDRRLELVLQGEMNKDIVIIGSSRGARDILAERIEDSTGYATYNLSYPGSDVVFHKFLLETLLKFNSPPRMVLLTVDDPAQLLADPTITFRLDRLYPLVRYPYIREELIRQGEKNALLDKLFILHQLSEANFVFTDKKFSRLDTLTSHGSMPISFQRADRAWQYIDADTGYYVEAELPLKLLSFSGIQELCKAHGIDLVLVIPPNYRTLNMDFYQRMHILAGHTGGLMAYNDQDTVFRDSKYYYDESHLMTTGAVIFSDYLMDYLEKRWAQDSSLIK